tara:strand:- start:1278 stop:1865 length:588 start_codon:yes stop_codon:yes gene_type:complete
MNKFRKRVFTPITLVSSLMKAVISSPILIAGLIKPATSRALREKVMLATTSVNDCRYCSWVHTRAALNNGIDIEEVNQLLAGVTGNISDEKEAVAIIFAQHYAEEMTKASNEMKTTFNEAFKGRAKLEVLSYIYAIYFANLAGNTFDALLARFKGKKSEDSSFFVEVLSSLISAPVLVAIMVQGSKDKTGRFDAL